MTKIFALKNDDQYDARFLHLRSKYKDDLSKKRTSNNEVDIAYGGVTIAYNPLLIIRKNGGVGVCVEVGGTRCSGWERYVKATGREKSYHYLQNPNERNYALLYLGEGDTLAAIQQMPEQEAQSKIPLIFNAAGDLYIDERLYDLRGAITKALGYEGY